MKKMILCVMMLLVVSLGSACIAKAELLDRGNGMYYDTDYNITWYAYPLMANLYWHEAAAWAAALNVKGITGWRLPSAYNKDGTGPCFGMYCKMSEYGHLYYTELANPGYPVSPNFGPFESTAHKFYYWTGTEGLDPTKAYIFQMDSGDSLIGTKTVDTSFAWAVHDGDPASPAAPPPPVTPPTGPVVPPVVCPTVPPPVVPVSVASIDIEVFERSIFLKKRGIVTVVIF